MAQPRIEIPYEEIAEFCQRWQITEFALFGSVLRDDFGPESDIDVLVTFAPEARWGLRFVDMQEELEALLHRPIDVLTRWSIEHSENPYRRGEILGTAEVIYHAAA